MSRTALGPGHDGLPGNDPAPIEKLPLLIIELFCEYLAQPDSLKQDLASFSLASTLCAAGAARYRLRRLHLRISGPKKLLEDLQCIRLEQRRHLREIKLAGAMLGVPEQGKFSRRASRVNLTVQARNPDPLLDLYGDFCLLPRCFAATVTYDPFEQPFYEEYKQRLDDAWRPLSDFLLKLSSLTDMVYACSEQFPRCLLTTLHERLPRTRLHVHTFSLRSLYHHSYAKNLDPDEFKLATSPNLHSVASIYYPFDGRDQPGYNKEALESMVAGLAPNLKQCITWSCPPKFPRRLRRGTNPKLPWRGFDGEGTAELQNSRGSLESLNCGVFETQSWLERTHPEELVNLSISQGVNARELETLFTISDTVGFKRLRSLTMSLPPRPGLRVDGSDGDGTAALLFRNLLPLEALNLGGSLTNSIFEAIMDRHGSSLQRLRLNPASMEFDDEPPRQLYLGLDNVTQLASRCQNIVNLDLLVPRSEGNSEEVAIYRALGRMPMLRRLHLRLDCFSKYVYEIGDQILEETIESDGVQLPVSELGKILINSAVDSSFARAVFSIMDTEGSRLEYLHIEPYNLGGLWPTGVDVTTSQVVHWIGQSWVCTRRQKGEDVAVHNASGGRGDGEILRLDFCGFDDFRKVWVDLWPGPEGDRREAWSSKPLDI